MAFNKVLACAALLLAVCYVTAAPAEAPAEAPEEVALAPKETLKRSASLGYGYALAPTYYSGWYPYSGGLGYDSSLYSYGYPSYYSGYSGYGGLGQGIGYGSSYGYGYGYPYGYSSYGW